MADLLDPKNGIAGLVVLLGLHLVLGVVKMVVVHFKEKEATLRQELSKNNTDSEKELTEHSMALRQNTDAIRELMVKISFLEQELNQLKTMKHDLQKLFSTIKVMAGKKWPAIKKSVEAESPP